MNTEPDQYQCLCPQGYSGQTCQIGELPGPVGTGFSSDSSAWATEGRVEGTLCFPVVERFLVRCDDYHIYVLKPNGGQRYAREQRVATLSRTSRSISSSSRNRYLQLNNAVLSLPSRARLRLGPLRQRRDVP